MSAIPPLLLSASDVAEAAPRLPDIIALVEQTYLFDAQGKVDVPTKVGVHPHGPQSFLHAMPAWVPDAQALGLKWVSFFPGNSQYGLPDSSALIILNDPDSGIPVAIMEGMWITYARTSACAALAAKYYCAHPQPKRLGLVGCGGLGEWSLRALSAIFPSITEVYVSSARAQTRNAFCLRMATQGQWHLTPVDEVRDAVQDMDIVVSSVPKLEKHPIRAEWWSPGTLLIPLDVTGAWDDDTYRLADRLVCDHHENLERAFERYRPNLALDNSRLHMLQDRIGRGTNDGHPLTERTLAFITGISSLDMTLAWNIYRRAQEKGLGSRYTLS